MTPARSTGGKTQGWSGGEGSPSERARPMGWGVGSESRDQLLGLLLVRRARSRTHLPATSPYHRCRGTSKHLVKSRTKHAGLKQELPNAAGHNKRRRERGHTDHSLPVRPPLPLKRRTTTPHTGRGATAGAEETAASHSRDSSSAGIAGADANEDAEAIAGSTNTDHGSRVSSLSGYAGQTGKYRESQDRYADRNQEQTPKRSRARNKTAHSSRDTSSME